MFRNTYIYFYIRQFEKNLWTTRSCITKIVYPKIIFSYPALSKTESKNMKELIGRVLNAVCNQQVREAAKKSATERVGR